jgi:hypothetical protein
MDIIHTNEGRSAINVKTVKIVDFCQMCCVFYILLLKLRQHCITTLQQPCMATKKPRTRNAWFLLHKPSGLSHWQAHFYLFTFYNIKYFLTFQTTICGSSLIFVNKISQI